MLANGIRIHYLNWDIEGDGYPILLLHGLASNAHIWDFTAPILIKDGMKPIAWEARGHGLTDKPDHGCDLETITRDLGSFIQSCNLEKPLLVGHSWGGHLALNYAAKTGFGPFSPLGLVQVDGGITQLDDAPDASWEKVREKLTPPRLAGTPYQAFRKRLEAWDSFGQPHGSVEKIIMHNFEVYVDESTGEELIRPYLSFDNHMRIVRALWEFQTYEMFGKVSCPVLALPARPSEPSTQREKDFLAAKERGLDVATNRIRELRVNWMENSVHDLPLQRPQELGELITSFFEEIR